VSRRFRFSLLAPRLASIPIKHPLTRHLPKVSVRFYDAKREYENLVEKYKEAGGCSGCLKDEKEICDSPLACPEKDEDKEIFRMVRTSILDTKERIYPKSKFRPELQIPEVPPGPIRLNDWENYFQTRGILGAKNPKFHRFLSKPLTFPLSVAQFFLDTIPYPLTPRGETTFAELRTLAKSEGKPYIRICFVGVRAELSFPATFWREIGHIFPNYNFSLLMVGPEAPLTLDRQMLQISKNVSLSCYKKYYHEVHQELKDMDYIPDLYVGLNSGVGFEGYKGSWDQTFQQIVETKRPFLLSCHDQRDQDRDQQFLKRHENQLDWLLTPTPNLFQSLFHDVLSLNIRYIIHSNWSIFAVQGK